MAQISIVSKNDVIDAQRFDAEYFKPEYIRETKLIENISHIQIGELAFVTDGQHGYHIVDENSNIAHLTARHMKNWFITRAGADMLSLETNTKNLRSELQVLDIVLSTRGSVGFAAIATSEVLPANIDQDVARISLNPDESISPYYLLAYLNSYFGQNWIKKNCTGMVQQGLSLQKVRQVKIPILSEQLQREVEHTIVNSYSKISKSKQFYKEAEKILLEDLGLLNFKPKHKLTFETTKSKIEKAERFDAEYFQPKYKEIVDKIESYEGGFKTIGKALEFNDKNFFPAKDKEYTYIPLSKVSANGVIDYLQKEMGEYLPTRARRKVKVGDIILSSIEGSIETSAVILKEHNNFIVSNGFYVFQSKLINSETLFVLFKSQIMLELLRKISKGAILGGYDLKSFKTLSIPIIKPEIQNIIAEKIIESHNLRKESKQLLENAKKMVEDEIEKLAGK